MSQKKQTTFISAITSAKVDQFSCFYHCLFQKGSAEEAQIKTAISPQICCRTTLRNVSGQLHSLTAPLIQFKVIQRRLITVNIHEDVISLFLYTDYFTTTTSV